MKIYQLLFIALIAVLFIGCSGGNQAVSEQTATPTETLKSFIEASKKKDVETIKKTLSKNSLIMVERAANVQNTTVDQLFSRENPALPNETPEIRNEKIEGETASVEVKDQTGGYDTIPFVKEEGVWKIAFDTYQKSMMEKMRKEMGNTENPQQQANTNQANRSKPDGEKQPSAPANKSKTNK